MVWREEITGHWLITHGTLRPVAVKAKVLFNRWPVDLNTTQEDVSEMFLSSVHWVTHARAESCVHECPLAMTMGSFISLQSIGHDATFSMFVLDLCISSSRLRLAARREALMRSIAFIVPCLTQKAMR